MKIPRINSLNTAIKAISFLIFVLSIQQSFAEGQDLLQGTTATALSTFNGSIKTFIYLLEIIMAVGVYIKTRNFMALGGIVVVAFFINVIAMHFLS